MTDPKQRFSDRVELYRKYRPGYPPEVLKALEVQCGLTPESTVADVGSGTGIFSGLLLDRGCRVLAIEPNESMRAVAEREFADNPRFRSLPGSAEATGLDPQSVDLIVAAQAFHWFDPRLTREEFRRILRPGSWVALIWNARRKTSTPFLCAYEDLLLRLGTDYGKVDHMRHDEIFFADLFDEQYDHISFYYYQDFDLEGLKGRVFSSSYTPPEGHPERPAMERALEGLFEEHAENGTVRFEYDTEIYFGQLLPNPPKD